MMKPPPLSPRGPSPPPIRTSFGAPRSSKESELDSGQRTNQILYCLAALLFILALALMIVAARMYRDGNSSGSGSSAGAADGGNPMNSQSGDPSTNDNKKDSTSTSPVSETSESREEQPEAIADLPVIPILRQGAGKSGTSITAQDGTNPFLGVGDVKSVVFVIDQSSSMGGDSKLPRVINALNEAINHLNEDQRFLVIFFSDQPHLHTSLHTLAHATENNKTSIKDWLRSIYASGGTYPFDAMEYAIRQNPERIVILSDGEFDPFGGNKITAHNQALRKPIRIDAIGLAENVLTLQELAKMNHGIYYQAR